MAVTQTSDPAAGSEGAAQLRRTRLAGVLALLLVVASLTALALLLVTARTVEVEAGSYANLVLGVFWTLGGLLVVQAQPRNACGWLLLGAGSLGVVELAGQYASLSAHVADDPLPLADLAAWVAAWGWSPYVLVLPLLLLLVPDGHLPSTRWRPFAAAVVVMWLLLTASLAVAPGETEIHPGVENPWAVDAVRGADLLVAVGSWWASLVALPVSAFAALQRLWRAVDAERAWLVLAGPVALLAVPALLISLDAPVARELYVVALLGPPAGLVVATVRHRLLDVEGALSRTLVLLVVVVLVVAVWAAVVSMIDDDVLRSRTGAVVIALLAVGGVVLRSAVQQAVDRLVFPHRQGARVVSGRIAQAVSRSAEPQEALGQLLDAVRAELRLPYVAFRGETDLVRGERADAVVRVPAVTLGRTVGHLEVSPRRAGVGLDADERRVLGRVGAQAGVLAYAAGLVADAQEGRSRVARVREDERRRLRDDLSARLVPGLDDVVARVDDLADGLAGTPEEAVARSLRAQLQEATEHVASVTRGLRPPVLDQLGLGDALRRLVRDLGPLRGVADVADLPPLPAATEVAAYTVAAESVANAVRHASAASVRLSARVDDATLVIVVADDGRGLPARPRPGVGLTSVRERAVELRGTVEHRPRPGGGTQVVLRLPLPASPAQDDQAVGAHQRGPGSEASAAGTGGRG